MTLRSSWDRVLLRVKDGFLLSADHMLTRDFYPPISQDGRGWLQ